LACVVGMTRLEAGHEAAHEPREDERREDRDDAPDQPVVPAGQNCEEHGVSLPEQARAVSASALPGERSEPGAPSQVEAHPGFARVRVYPVQATEVGLEVRPALGIAAAGLEPATRGLCFRCSNQLSYAAKPPDFSCGRRR